MSAEKVDVLAAVKDPGFAAYSWQDVTRPNPTNITEDVRAYLAVVAELVEADKQYDEARADWDGVWEDDADPLAIRERFDAACARRQAAIAKATQP